MDNIATNPVVNFGGSLLFYILMSLGLYLAASKRKEEFSWFAFVPVLNLLLIAKVGKFSPWLWLLLFVPIVGWVFMAYAYAKFAEEVGSKSLYGWLMIIPCFTMFMPLVIGLTATER